MMKKFVLGTLFLCTSTAFTADCNFNLHFNGTWTSFKHWVVTIVDVTNSTEVVGGFPVYYQGFYPTTNLISFTVKNCTNKTQLGIFGHSPGLPGKGASNDESASLESMAYEPNVFLEGMSRCVGDFSPDPSTWSNLTLTVGNPIDPGARPNNFEFTRPGDPYYRLSWSKSQLEVTCKNAGLDSENVTTDL